MFSAVVVIVFFLASLECCSAGVQELTIRFLHRVQTKKNPPG